jgi:hypothetical protein
VNVFLKNRRYALKNIIKGGGSRLVDCQKEHWEILKRFMALIVKQEKVVKNCGMKAHVMIHHPIAKVVKATTKYHSNMGIHSNSYSSKE